MSDTEEQVVITASDIAACRIQRHVFDWASHPNETREFKLEAVARNKERTLCKQVFGSREWAVVTEDKEAFAKFLENYVTDGMLTLPFIVRITQPTPLTPEQKTALKNSLK